MRINFLVNHIQGGWEPTDKRLGGTERGIQEWAEELVKRGHEIVVFRNGHDETSVLEYNGVIYSPREAYNSQVGFTINVKSPEVKGSELFYTNNTDSSELDLSSYGGVIHISNWAKQHLPVNNPNVYVVPHGYDSSKIYQGKKILKQCLYASSPDRGLDTLLRAWPHVLETHPDATLIVTYGAQEYDLPNVKFLDATEDEMNQLYIESDIWAYPCNGGELQCITGLKAQAAGCVPVIIPTMALIETVKWGVFARGTKDYATRLIFALYRSEELRYQRPIYYYSDLQDSTDRLLKVIAKVLK